ncbi:MAG: hypothetical protein E4H23_06085 [Chrysiogenales bacterium]|nr:MAG: hypothetical protein E4H23_06085 [Chrysiogenales bacterium]
MDMKIGYANRKPMRSAGSFVDGQEYETAYLPRRFPAPVLPHPAIAGEGNAVPENLKSRGKLDKKKHQRVGFIFFPLQGNGGLQPKISLRRGLIAFRRGPLKNDRFPRRVLPGIHRPFQLIAHADLPFIHQQYFFSRQVNIPSGSVVCGAEQRQDRKKKDQKFHQCSSYTKTRQISNLRYSK